MTLFMIERNFAEQLEFTAEGAEEVIEINDEVGVKWIVSFLTADKRKTYCLYEANDMEAIREAAQRADIPADEIIEVTQHRPEWILAARVPTSNDQN